MNDFLSMDSISFLMMNSTKVNLETHKADL